MADTLGDQDEAQRLLENPYALADRARPALLEQQAGLVHGPGNRRPRGSRF